MSRGDIISEGDILMLPSIKNQCYLQVVMVGWHFDVTFYQKPMLPSGSYGMVTSLHGAY